MTLAQQPLPNILPNNVIRVNFTLTSSLLGSKQEAKFSANWGATSLCRDSCTLWSFLPLLGDSLLGWKLQNDDHSLLFLLLEEETMGTVVVGRPKPPRPFWAALGWKTLSQLHLPKFTLSAYKHTRIQLIRRLKVRHNMSFALLTMSWENRRSQQV